MLDAFSGLLANDVPPRLVGKLEVEHPKVALYNQHFAKPGDVSLEHEVTMALLAEALLGGKLKGWRENSPALPGDWLLVEKQIVPGAKM